MTRPGSRVRNLFVNTSALFLATLFSRVVSVPISALLVRTLNPGDFGQYSYLTAYVGLYAVLATFGLPVYLSREVVQQPQRAPVLLKTAYILQAVFSTITLLLILAIGGTGQSTTEVRLLLLSALGLIGTTTATFFLYVMSGLNRSYISAAVQFVSSLLNSLVLLLVIFLKPDLEALIWALAFTGLSQHLLSYLAFKYYCKELTFAPGWPAFEDFKRVLLEALPYVFLVSFSALYFKVDIVMLEAFGTLEQIADYSAAYKFIEIIIVLVGVIGMVFFAEFSNLYAQGGAGMEIVMKRGFRYMVLIALPITALLTFYARDVLFLFYGDKYLQSTAMLQVLAWASFFLFARNLQMCLMQSRNQIKTQALIFALGALLNVILNYYWIPLLGGLGCSVATLVCEVFSFVAFTYFIDYKFGISLWEPWVGPTALAFGVMITVLWLVAAVGAVFGTGLALFSFVGTLWVSGGILPDDLAYVRRITARLIRKVS